MGRQFYDAVGIIYQAVRANRNEPDAREDSGEYTRALSSPEKSYEGLLGRVFFDQSGDGSWPPVIAQIESSNPPRWKLLNR